MKQVVTFILWVAITTLTACSYAEDSKPLRKTLITPENKHLLYSGYAQLNVTASRASCDRLILDSPFHVDNPSTSIRFRTNAKSVAVVLEYAAKTELSPGHHAYSSNGLCLVDGQKRGTCTRLGDAGGRQTIDLSTSSPGSHTYEILLPVADKVTFCGVELSEGERLSPIKEKPKLRFVPYGDSITQGFWASDPSKTYPYLVARERGWQLVNMGFGSRTATPSDGEAVAELHPDLVTILIGVNDCLGNAPLSAYRESVRGLISNLRKAKASLPIYVITPLNIPGQWKGTEKIDQYREVLRGVVKESGDANLRLIEGPDLIPNATQYFQDGLHPNDAGFALMAERLQQKLKENRRK
ncbi:MAG: hypothetical protein HY318_18585 [Armatimonadetes bacterium]|nr:hypothetical protein [Armatimonadota bacterium]